MTDSRRRRAHTESLAASVSWRALFPPFSPKMSSIQKTVKKKHIEIPPVVRSSGCPLVAFDSYTNSSQQCLKLYVVLNQMCRFPVIDEEEMAQSTTPASNGGGGGKKKKSSSGKNKQDWGKKHKRKMASLLTMAEQDRRLSLMHLPPLPTSAARFPEKSHSNGLECCPTVVEMVQPSGGTNMEGHVVELYRHGDLDQRIYEHSCRPDVLNQPCRFVEKLLRPLSRCVQQFSFTYAVVADHPSGNQWRLDYIRIRNGCACEIQPP